MKKIVISIVIILAILSAAYFLFLFYLTSSAKIEDSLLDYIPISLKTDGNILTPFEYKGYLMQQPIVQHMPDMDYFICTVYLHPQNDREKFESYWELEQDLQKKSRIINALHETRLFPTERLKSAQYKSEGIIDGKKQSRFDKAHLCIKLDDIKKFKVDSLLTFKMIYIDDLMASIIITEPDTSIPELMFHSYVFQDSFTTSGYATAFEIDSVGMHEVIRFKIFKDEESANKEPLRQTAIPHFSLFSKYYVNYPMYCEYYSKDNDNTIEKFRQAAAFQRGLNIKATGSFNFNGKINDIFDVEIIE